MSRHIRQRALSMAHVAVACVWHACVLDWLEPEVDRLAPRRYAAGGRRQSTGGSTVHLTRALKDSRHWPWRAMGRVDVIIFAVQYNS